MRGNTQTSREKRKELTGAVAHGAGSCGGEECLTPWDVQSKRIFPEGGTARSNPREGDPSPTLGTDQRALLVCLAMASGAANAEVGDDMSPTITARSFKDAPVLLSNGEDVVAPLMARDGKRVGSQFVRDGKVLAEPSAEGWTVRRLTPMEFERLQGFPDGWTDVPYRGAEHPPDAPRYKALGNSMAVPVMRWIGERMDIVDGIASKER